MHCTVNKIKKWNNLKKIFRLLLNNNNNLKVNDNHDNECNDNHDGDNDNCDSNYNCKVMG